MSTNAIINVRNLDINRVNFIVGQAKSGRNPNINIKYDGQNLQLRLPKMRFPGGVLVRENDQPVPTSSYTLIGSLNGADTYGKERSHATDDTAKLYNFLLDLEDKIIASAVENSVKWFGKKRSEEAIRDGFKKLMRLSVDKVDGEYVPNGKYPPSMTIKVPVYDNRVGVDIIDTKGNPVYVTPSSLNTVFPKGIEANLVVSGSIYVIAGGGFGVTWRLTYAQVFPQARMTAANVFMPEEEEAEEEETAPAPAPAPAETDTAIDVEIPDLDDAPAPVAAPAPAKKRRVAAPAT
jgi:hypothetical protein